VHPLYALIRKGAQFKWTAQGEVAFEALKSRLLAPTILTYPNFTRNFILETDASKHILGAILSQHHQDNKLHPVAGQYQLLNRS